MCDFPRDGTEQKNYLHRRTEHVFNVKLYVMPLLHSTATPKLNLALEHILQG
jgi:hypothetical protein